MRNDFLPCAGDCDKCEHLKYDNEMKKSICTLKCYTIVKTVMKIKYFLERLKKEN